ncbi:hypothetical protein GCM10027578_23750 [Spirosoma luteolum]
MVIVRGTDYVIETLNEAWATFWAKPGDVAAGQPLLSVLGEPTAHLYRPLLEMVFATGQSQTGVELPVDHRPSQAVRYLSLTLTVLPATDTQSAGIGLIETDITELVLARWQAEHQASVGQVQASLMHDRITQTTGQIREQAAFLEQLIELSSVGVIISQAVRDEAGHIVDFELLFHNQAVLPMTGLTSYELTTQSFRTLFGREPDLFDHYVDLVENNRTNRRERYSTTTQRWLDVTGTRFNDGFMVMFSDITNYHQVLEENRKQADLLQKVLDNSPVSIVVTQAVRDETGQIVDFEYQLASSEADRLGNLAPGDSLLGRRLLETFPGDRASGMFTAFCRVVETREPLVQETHYQDDHTDRWLYVRCVPHGNGFIQTSLDITPVKQAEALVQSQSQLLQDILDNAQTGIALHRTIRDAGGQIIDFETVQANRQALQLWGGRAEEFMTRTYLELMTGDDVHENLSRFRRVVETGQPDRFEVTAADRVLDINTARSGDGVVVSTVDVTADRQYRQKLEEINVELKRSNENLQAFAYVASHDLQEPLRKIISFGSILHDRHAPQLGADGEEIVSRMQHAAERMAALIRDLLTYARVGSQQEAFAPVRLGGMIDELIEDLWYPIQTSGALVEVGPLPMINGDRIQLRQLFQNLLSNALKFIVEGRKPVVSFQCERITPYQLPDHLPATMNRRNDYWAIRISDNGIGFESEHSERVFKVFQRLHVRNKYAGTGIGLAVVRKVAENHGGTVTAESEPGEGTTFTVYLPA